MRVCVCACVCACVRVSVRVGVYISTKILAIGKQILEEHVNRLQTYKYHVET